MKRILTLTVLGAAMLAVSASAATVTVHTSLANFNASTVVGGTPTYTENFNTNASLFSTFSITGASSFTSNSTVYNRAFQGSGYWLDQVASNTKTTQITLNSGNLTAFGADWNLNPLGTDGIAQGVKVTLNFLGGGTYVYEINSTAGFFGFTSDTAITSIVLSGGSGIGSVETFSLDNAVFEAAAGDIEEPPPSTVPEPSTFGLMGAAMVGLGLLRRVRR